MERNRTEPPAGRGEGDNVVRLPGADRAQAGAQAGTATQTATRDWRGIAEPNSAVARGLEQVVQVEPGFDPRAFLEGAKGAYETIVTAFAKGDRKTLRALLSREVCEGFERAIDRLAAYKAPRAIRFLNALPRTANGKVQRKRLAETAA